MTRRRRYVSAAVSTHAPLSAQNELFQTQFKILFAKEVSSLLFYGEKRKKSVDSSDAA